MPIRFRCPHCDQLLGIARRKAGQSVDCPTCRRPVTVPDPDAPAPRAAPAAARPGGPPPHLFERDDFDELLNLPSAPPAPRRLPAPASLPASAPPPPPGVVVSPARATALTVAAVVGLAAAFGAGVLVGRFGFGP